VNEVSQSPPPAHAASRFAPSLAARLRRAEGQASVELVGLLPLVAVVAAAGWSVVAAQVAGEQAAAAAEAGAAALVQSDGADACGAARAVLPGGVRARIVVAGRQVRVHVEPRLPLPGLADLLAADAEADAGPEPRP
jgi:hypothetical protein